MKGTHCDGKGGWTRVGYVNMSESGATCPIGLTQQQYNNIDHKLCGRPNPSSAGCSSTTFSTLGLSYYKVCRQVRGYQFHSPDAFAPLGRGIDSYCVNGISITHGKNPRKYLWTYACGLQEDRKNVTGCPCNKGYYGGKNPGSSFVTNHYYCESDLNPSTSWTNVLYVDDPLWDGKNCDSLESSCCTNSKMPWFYRVLDNTTQDDIELRVCANEVNNNEDTPLDIIELCVQWTYKVHLSELQEFIINLVDFEMSVSFKKCNVIIIILKILKFDTKKFLTSIKQHPSAKKVFSTHNNSFYNLGMYCRKCSLL